MTSNIDDTDMKVLDALKENSRATVREISKKIDMPITTVHNRLKKLKIQGIIKKFTIEPDYEKLGKGVTAFIFTVVDHERIGQAKNSIEDFKKTIHQLPEVEKVFALTGDIDWMLLVRVGSIKELDDFLLRKLRAIKGVVKSTTQIVLEED